MKRIVYILLIGSLLAAPACMAMVGAPVFTIGKQLTSMTVEYTQVEMDVPFTSDGSTHQTMLSQRLFLIGRYGLENNIDMGIKLGVADLSYNKLGGGYSDYASSPAFSWGVGLRAGYPTGEKYQITGSLSYLGFKADATTRAGDKSITSKYGWQEVVPSVTFGYRIGDVVPYVGAQKPYLFGTKEYTVSYNGQNVPAAGGDGSYMDGEQALRGLFGLEWIIPDGYSISGEASVTSSGTWILSAGLAQAIR
jgi:hypothetical protein